MIGLLIENKYFKNFIFLVNEEERSKKMKKFLYFFVFVAILASLSVGAKQGCTAFEKTAGGAVLGTMLGAGIGAATGNWGLGAAIGGGVGALGGAAVAAMTDSRGNELTEEEVREARIQALEMEGQYDPDLYALRIDRDANDQIRVVPYLKPQKTKKLELIN